LESNARRRPVIRNAMVVLILGVAVFAVVDTFGSLATEPWLVASRLKTPSWADPGLRLRALIIVFAGIAAIRLILVGLLRPDRRWSLIVGATILALSLARELPGFF
jgi:hypothetical protein